MSTTEAFTVQAADPFKVKKVAKPNMIPSKKTQSSKNLSSSLLNVPLAAAEIRVQCAKAQVAKKHALAQQYSVSSNASDNSINMKMDGPSVLV